MVDDRTRWRREMTPQTVNLLHFCTLAFPFHRLLDITILNVLMFLKYAESHKYDRTYDDVAMIWHAKKIMLKSYET